MIPQTIKTDLLLNTVLIRRTSGRNLGTCKHNIVLWNIGEHRTAQGKITFRQLNKGWMWFRHERIMVDCRVNRDENTTIVILAPDRNMVGL
jgi:hypothetical protein